MAESGNNLIEMALAAMPPETPCVILVVDPDAGVQYILQHMDTITMAGWLAMMRLESDASFIDALAQRAQQEKSNLAIARVMPQDHKRRVRPS